MNTLQILRWLEKHLAEERRGAHMRNQINRFVFSLLASLIASLTASQGHVSWATLWTLLPPALWVAAEETWPSLPWKTVQGYLHGAAQSPIVPPAPLGAPQADPPSDSAQSPGGRQ